jgi:IS5 family transposase
MRDIGMSKEAVSTMKLEPELREQFMAEAEASHRPASQVIVKRQFGYMKTRYRGLAKNTAQLTVLFALANVYQVRRLLMPQAQVRP